MKGNLSWLALHVHDSILPNLLDMTQMTYTNAPLYDCAKVKKI